MRANIPLSACMDAFASPTFVDDFYSSAINARTTAKKYVRSWFLHLQWKLSFSAGFLQLSIASEVSFTYTSTYCTKNYYEGTTKYAQQYKKGKVDHASHESIGGAHLPLPGLEPVRGEPLMSVTRGQCDARPMVNFPATRHHNLLTGNKLYCLLTEAHVC